MQQKHSQRLIALLLTLAVMLGMAPVSAFAETLGDSNTVTIKRVNRDEYLDKSSGGSFGGGAWTYTSNKGTTGAAYCINWGLGTVAPSKALTLQKYNRNPKTMGAFANGYPQRSLEQFKELHQSDVRGVANLTENEYAYATQIAVWSTCGQVSVPGTPFTAGRASLVEPTSDAQKIRVFDAVKAILTQANGWTHDLTTGLSVRAEENTDVRGVEIVNEFGLQGAADSGTEGINLETINGKQYYTRTMYVSSATSSWVDSYLTKIYSNDAPSGTIYTTLNNTALQTTTYNGKTCYLVDTSNNRQTNLNANYEEFYGAFKVAIPVESAAAEGSFNIKAVGRAGQYNLFLAYNSTSSEQSYIVADPGYTSLEAQMPFKWTSKEELEETASLQVVKAGAGGAPLEGAEFTLLGSGGTNVVGRSDRNGRIEWSNLPADESYTLTESKAPAGYNIVDPVNITLQAGRTNYLTVRNNTEKSFRVKKIDAQNKSSLPGAVFRFEQIDGGFTTTGTTGFDGIIEFSGTELPYGSYRVVEQSAPTGYQKSTKVETVEWTGKEDVMLTFENVRDIGLTIVKIDEDTGTSLPNATFDVYADGKLLTSVTTNDAGEAKVNGIKQEAYIEIVETSAPDGYVLDKTPHGIHIDPYNPALQDDPVLTVTNKARPALRIVKYDNQSKKPLSDVTFEIYKDSKLIGSYTTDGNGEIFLYDLAPGTYLVQEVATDDNHIVNSTPQQVELKAGQTETQTLVFFNQLKPGIHLVKVDSQTMKSLPNVRFEFKLVGGSYKQEFTADANGEIDLSKLPVGAFQVRELEAPEGYLIDNEIRTVQINPDENANFVFTNTKKPSFTLVKLDSFDSQPLGGVTFRIAKIEDGSHYLDRITDTQGKIHIDNLEPGIYSIQEIDVPENYVKNTEEFHVELFPGRNSEIVITNDRKSSLTIRKTDKDTGKPVAGVTFTLNHADGATITTEPTGADGTVTLYRLAPGVYTIREQSVPENYLLDTTPQQITIVANRNAEVNFQNYQRPTLKISKTDINGKNLTGAVFEVKTKAGVKIGDFPVGADGTITISNVHLDEGYYIVTEKVAPAGYILDTTSHEVYLRPGKTTEISIENEQKPGLTIIKIDSVVGDGIKGAKFELWVSKDKTQNGTYQKLNDTFYYTDENGLIELPQLDTGWYKVKEVEAAAGYLLKAPSEQILYVEHDKASSITFENIPKSALVIRKIDADSGAPLANAWFRVRYLGGTSGSGGTIIGEYQTSANGNIIVTGMKAGTYICEEINAPNGYVMDTAPQTAYISGQEQDCLTLTFTNSKYGSLLIKKVDSLTNEPLADVQFNVVDSAGTVIGNSNGYFTTDSAGTILISDIKPGTTLVVKETRANEGYLLDDTPQTIKIDSNETKTLEFRNAPKGGLIIRKIDSTTKEPLAGVEFKITTAAGELLPDNEGLTSSNGLYYTDGNGQIVLSKLTGTFTVTETKALPDYILDAQPQTVVVNAGDTQTLTFENTPKGCLVVKKIDSITKEPLAGVEFEVKGCDGCTYPAGTYKTDANGMFRLSHIPSGCYSVVETKAKSGYLLDDTVHTVKVEGAACKEVTFENQPLGSLLIKKMDAQTKKPLSGVIFKVTYADGTVVGTGNGEYRTDESGYITIPNLKPASYIVREVQAKENYLLDDTPKTIEIKDHQTYELEFFNEAAGSLIIQKKDSLSGKPLAGVIFKVTKANGEFVPDENGRLSSNGFYQTDASGQIKISGVVGTLVVDEYKTIPGYVIDEASRHQTVVVNPNDTQTLTFYNAPGTTLVVQKFAAGTKNEPLAGVKFFVTDQNGTPVGNSNGEYWTDDSGRIVISDIEPGSSITAREVATVDGYVLDGTPKTILIKEGEAQYLTFINQKAGTLVVQKKDKITGEPLAGVEFQITYAGGGYVDDANGHLSSKGMYKTDKNGEIRISGIVGTVVVKETKTLDGYLIDPATQTQTVVINPADTQTLVFENIPCNNLVIQKYEKGTSNPIAGVTFLVTTSDGSVVGANGQKYITDDSGRIVVEGVAPGVVVTAQELDITGNYALNTTPQSITIKEGEAQSLTFYNEPLANLTIYKVDSATGKPLANAQFLATDQTGAAVGVSAGHFTTGQNGSITIGGIVPGTVVTVREEKAPAGYVLNAEPQTITIQANKDNSLTFANEPKGALIIKKLDSVTNEPLAGAEFKITTSSGELVGNLEGAVTSNGMYKTDENGEIRITGLAPDSFVLTETKAPQGYLLNTQPQTVEVKTNDTQTILIYNDPLQTLTIQKFITGTTKPVAGATFLITDSSGAVVGQNNGIYTTDANGRIVLPSLTPGTTITAKETQTAAGLVLDSTPQSIQIKPGEAQTLTFYNSPEGGLELIKVSESDRGQRIANTKFEIRKMDGALVDTVITDKSGRVHIDLDAGDYYAVELESASGFKLDNTPHYFTIKDGETTTLTVTNKPFSGILIHKIDSVTKQGIYGVTFLLYDGNMNPIDQFTSDQNGYVYVNTLELSGKVFLRELDNPGYITDSQLKTIYIKPGQTTEVVWENTPVTGQIQIVKKSADYNPINGLPAGSLLQGATFDIFNERTGNKVDTIVSNANGLAVSKQLPLGRYTVKESKAPANYSVNNADITAVLEYEGQIVKFEVADESANTGVAINKTGPKETMSGQPVRYVFSGIGNTGTVMLDSFYWRDTLPAQVRLQSIVTGTYNRPGNYKIVYKVNNGGDYRTLADNLSTSKNYTLVASPAALGLASNERVTEVMFVFGQVPGGFAQVEAPMLHCQAISGLVAGTSIANTADVGGVYNDTWQQAVSRWVTTVYGQPVKLPKTGY